MDQEDYENYEENEYAKLFTENDSWVDAGNGLKINSLLRSNSIPKNGKAYVTFWVWNTNEEKEYDATLTLGVELKKINEGFQSKIEKIPPNKVGESSYYIGTKKAKKYNQDYKLGVYFDIKTGKGKAMSTGKTLIRLIASLFIGRAARIIPGSKVSGYSHTFRIVEALQCPKCNQYLDSTRYNNNTGFWECPTDDTIRYA